jgi:carbon-monoxide dehydrogenase medium subunit
MPDFDLHEPHSVTEACALLAESPDDSTVIAGGTDVLVNLKEGLIRPRRLISLARIDGLDRVECSPEHGLSIGAMATVNQVARDEMVGRLYPGVVDAALSLAADQVRNLATVAGNLCSAVPSADMAPILLAHNARLRVVSPDGERMVPIRDLFVGPRETVLAPAEVVVSIDVAPPASGSGDASLRQGGRVSLSLPIAGAAAVVSIDGDRCREAGIALGAVAPTPIMAARASTFLIGKQLTTEVLDEAGELASSAARPIDDLRGSKAYRYELLKVLTRRVLTTAAERARS